MFPDFEMGDVCVVRVARLEGCVEEVFGFVVRGEIEGGGRC